MFYKRDSATFKLLNCLDRISFMICRKHLNILWLWFEWYVLKKNELKTSKSRWLFIYPERLGNCNCRGTDVFSSIVELLLLLYYTSMVHTMRSLRGTIIISRIYRIIAAINSFNGTVYLFYFKICSHPKVLLIKKLPFFVVNESDAWVATFLEADVNKVIPRLSVKRNLNMYRISVVLLQSIAYSIVANQKSFIVIRQVLWSSTVYFAFPPRY